MSTQKNDRDGVEADASLRSTDLAAVIRSELLAIDERRRRAGITTTVQPANLVSNESEPHQQPDFPRQPAEADELVSVALAGTGASDLIAIIEQQWRAGIEKRKTLDESLGHEKDNQKRLELVQREAERKNLVGLALSGGGIRSASFCLGVLQGLHRKGVLPVIDYLSTVSGGGFAGAYLSSSALKSPSQNASQLSGEETDKKILDNRLTESLGNGEPKVRGPQPNRIQNLIENGGFLLKKKLGGLNRWLFGLFLIWGFVASGVAMVASLMAYLYRQLDYQSVRQFIGVLGFDNDVRAAMFPVCLMLLIYVLLWFISYWKYGRFLKGKVTRKWMVLTIIIALTGLATLLGNGDISTSTITVVSDKGSDENLKVFLSQAWTFLVSALMAGLLPYLAPTRLFQSGGETANTWEKVTYYIASRVLVYGMPFLAVAYFAKEGISDFQNTRDARIVPNEVKDWTKSRAPFWDRVEQQHQSFIAATNAKPEKGAKSDEESKRAMAEEDANRPGHVIWKWVNFGKVHQPFNLSSNEIRAIEKFSISLLFLPSQPVDAFFPTSAVFSSISAMSFIGNQKDLFDGLDSLYAERLQRSLRQGTTPAHTIPQGGWMTSTNRVGPLARWYYFLQYLTGKSVGADDLYTYQFEMWWNAERKLQEERERIVTRLNQLLLSPDFYLCFPSEITERDFPKENLQTYRRAFLGAQGLGLRYTKDNDSKNWTPVETKAIGEGPSKALSKRHLAVMPTPWLTELRPRWALLPNNIDEQPAILSRDDDGDQKRKRGTNSAKEEELSDEAVRVQSEMLQWMPPQRGVDWKSSDFREWPPQFEAPLSSDAIKLIQGSQVASFYVPKPLPAVESFARVKDCFSTHESKRKRQWQRLGARFWFHLPTESVLATSGTFQDFDNSIERLLLRDLEDQRAVLEANRKLLEVYYGDTLYPKNQPLLSYVVLEADQETRFRWFWGSAIAFLVFGLLVDLNATSWHNFFGERIAANWIEETPGVRRQIPLAMLNTTQCGFPYHLISGSMTKFRRFHLESLESELFLFSQGYCGSQSTGYLATEAITDENYYLGNAIAISGGAVSPLDTNNLLQQWLLILANFRLGQWVQNPGYQRRVWKWIDDLLNWWMISPFRFLGGLLLNSYRRKNCFVSDGGLVENLGIEPLLLRRCKLILAVDAGQDGRFEFHDLAKVLREAEVKHGIRVTWEKLGMQHRGQPAELAPLVPTCNVDTATSQDHIAPDALRHYVLGRIEYPLSDTEQSEIVVGYLIYMKTTVCATDPVTVLKYQHEHPQFPHEPTTDLAFNAEQFESYRQLGQYTAETTLDEVSHEVGITAGDLKNRLLSGVSRRCQTMD